jgi:UDP-2,3-diacylglucosamine hydrolase
MTQAVPRFAALNAPAHWRTVDFISDLHLQASEPATFDVWQRYMQTTQADAVFMLGDLFEVWVGDDVIGLAGERFEKQCAQVMRTTGDRLALFFMHGNRDFLLGKSLLKKYNTCLLDDPCVLQWGDERWLISHGDALCIDDLQYMAFRAQVRTTEWQQTFLAKPLTERQIIAKALRAQSEAKKKSGVEYVDVDAPLARAWLNAANADTLIHGHTHKPAKHDLSVGMQRIVLSDWDAAANPVRAEVLRLTATGLERIALA